LPFAVFVRANGIVFLAPAMLALFLADRRSRWYLGTIIAFWCATRKYPVFAGLLIGLACALKPQVAGIFVLFYVLTREWKVAFTAVATVGLIAIGSIAAMQFTHPNWLASWTNNIAATTEIGAVNDYSWAGHFRDHIIDLKMLLVSWIADPMILRIAIALVTIALLAWYARAFPRNEQRTTHAKLLALATLCAVFLLPVYHRVYDAALLVLALAWALSMLDDARRRRVAILMLIAMSPLLIPFDLAHMLSHRAPRLAEITQTAWWQTWLAPHYAWGLLVSALASLATLSRETAALSAPITVAPARASADTADITPEDDDEDIALAH